MQQPNTHGSENPLCSFISPSWSLIPTDAQATFHHPWQSVSWWSMLCSASFPLIFPVSFAHVPVHGAALTTFMFYIWTCWRKAFPQHFEAMDHSTGLLLSVFIAGLFSTSSLWWKGWFRHINKFYSASGPSSWDELKSVKASLAWVFPFSALRYDLSTTKIKSGVWRRCLINLVKA